MTQAKGVADEKLGILLRREQDLNRRVMEGTLNIDLVLSNLQKIIEGKPFNSKILNISANISLSDRITLGKYNWVNSNITEKNFSDKARRDYEAEYKLFHFNRDISSKTAIVEIEKEGFRPGNIHELLKLGEIQPNLQMKFPIVSLGSIWSSCNDNNAVPVLGYGGAERRLLLRFFGRNWSVSHRFLGVRK